MLPSSNSINEDQNQSANLNPNPSQIQPPNQVNRLHLKVIGGLMGGLLICWICFHLIGGWMKDRVPNKLGDKILKQQVVELAYPSQISFRAYYYYKKMLEQSSNNIKNKITYKGGNKQLNNIKFYELHDLFKVVKMIQKGKQFKPASKENNDDEIPIGDHLYNQPVNLSHLFGAAVDQYSCSSCYSFPIAATIQALLQTMNITVKLSEQQLIDCSKNDSKINGCLEGNLTKGFQYASQVGLVEDKYYPYRSRTGQSYACDVDIIKSHPTYKVIRYKKLPENNCQAIKSYLHSGIPVAVMIDAQRLSQLSEGEVYQDCISSKLNHAVTIVGLDNNGDWIVRNSWGTSFGKNGYFIMKGGKKCGTCKHAIVPQIAYKG